MLDIIYNDVKSLKIDLSQLKNKSILVTGATGLVGIYTLALLKTVHKELNIKIYTWNKNKIENVFEQLFDDCNKIVSDIVETESYKGLPKFDFIIHAAGYGQPGKFMLDKMKTIELNTVSTKLLLDKLETDGKFLFISTSELYSGLNIDSIDENMIGLTNTDHPRACYIEGKRLGETICNIYRQNGLDVKIARLSLAYGPGTRSSDARVLNSLIEKSIKLESINLLDSGSATRTYCYITDVIEMLFNILLNGRQVVYNVGGYSKLSILEMANKIGQLMNKSVVLPNSEEKLEGSPQNVNISIERYLNEFDKTNFIDFDQGLSKTLDWQKKLYSL